MLKCADCSQTSGSDGRVLCVEQVTGNSDLLAFFPDRASHETVWLAPDDVAELAKQIGAWAAKRGGESYDKPVRKVTGAIKLNT